FRFALCLFPFLCAPPCLRWHPSNGQLSSSVLFLVFPLALCPVPSDSVSDRVWRLILPTSPACLSRLRDCSATLAILRLPRSRRASGLSARIRPARRCCSPAARRHRGAGSATTHGLCFR